MGSLPRQKRRTEHVGPGPRNWGVRYLQHQLGAPLEVDCSTSEMLKNKHDITIVSKNTINAGVDWGTIYYYILFLDGSAIQAPLFDNRETFPENGVCHPSTSLSTCCNNIVQQSCYTKCDAILVHGRATMRLTTVTGQLCDKKASPAACQVWSWNISSSAKSRVPPGLYRKIRLSIRLLVLTSRMSRTIFCSV